jgi:hypothetical protein
VYHEISATGDGADSVAAADLDGDGDVDVLSASWTDAKIVWYANTNGAGSSWTPHLIATTSGSARSVVAADIDSDGDLDVLSGSRTGAQIVLYRNIDGAASFAPGQLISASAGEWVVAADVDGDGDPTLWRRPMTPRRSPGSRIGRATATRPSLRAR